MLKRFSLVVVIVVAILILDQFTKWLVASHMQVGESIYPIPALADFFSITFVTNTGVAFGLFQNGGVLFTIVRIIVIAVIVRYLLHMPSGRWLVRAALSMILAGAIGNLIDQLRLGYVIDFVAVGWWPKFNVADSSIVVGTIALAISMLLEGRPSPSRDTVSIHEGHEEARREQS